MAKRVVIIGGGFAGLSAGVRLSERGSEVLLLERRNHLGGRAYSFIDSKTGDVVDNGQHLFMGCYHHTIAFLEKIGRLDRLKFQDRPRVDFLDREGFTSFDCPPLPAPLHVLAGLLKMKGLGIGDKLRTFKVGRAIKSNGKLSPGALTVDQWLDELGQSARIKERFWYPMVVATLNQSPKIASARMLEVVLQEAFGGDSRSASIGISRVGLSDLYTDGACDFIKSRGGDVQTGAQVQRLIIERGVVAAVELKDGQRVEGDYFISAVPPEALSGILPDELRNREFAQLEALGSSPIVSINLWFDRPIIDREFVGLLGTRSQWIFNKGLILNARQAGMPALPGSPGKQSYQVAVIISAARDFVDWTKNDLVDLAISELHELLPASREGSLLHSVIVKEREATLSHTVESDSLRPGPRTSIPNLILAGDWTDTALPATIESAVMSGDVAAQIVNS
ncbi:MAG TPA: hydroxysqualene dehydroxylase HpnE [Blastocatellia bacterium]|nr:hydroxysqualene dehydroxylase HpnE [Blastocatellia bacterium]